MGDERTDSLASEVMRRWRAAPTGWSPLLMDPVLERVAAVIAPAVLEGSVVLDVGAGDASFAALLAGHRARVVAMDIDLARLTSHRGSDVLRVVGDATRLPFRSGTVDGVLAISVFQYVRRDAALDECRRVLRAGGRIAAVENLAGNPLIRAARAWMQARRYAYPRAMTPHAHLRWSESDAYAARFHDVTLDTIHLFAPGLMLFRATHFPLQRTPAGRLLRVAGGAAAFVDRQLIQRLRLERFAWLVVIGGRR